MPEMIEDLAGEILEKNHHLVTDKFKNLTTPYVISFIAPATQHELSRSLWLIQNVEQGNSLIESALYTHTCFNARGTLTQPKDIIAIEDVSTLKMQ